MEPPEDVPTAPVINPAIQAGPTLDWSENPAQEAVSVYRVYKVRGNSRQQVGTVTAPTSEMYIGDKLQGQRTTFEVRAVNVHGEGPASKKVTAQKH